MQNFRQRLQETLEDNKIEAEFPQREYSENEIMFQHGYNTALEDMLEEFDSEVENFYSFSKN